MTHDARMEHADMASGADTGDNDANIEEESDSCDGNNDDWSDDTDLSVT